MVVQTDMKPVSLKAEAAAQAFLDGLTEPERAELDRMNQEGELDELMAEISAARQLYPLVKDFWRSIFSDRALREIIQKIDTETGPSEPQFAQESR